MDAELKAYLNGLEIPEAELEGDPIENFLASAGIVGETGRQGWNDVDGLGEETSQFDARFRKRFQSAKKTATAAAPLTDDSDDSLDKGDKGDRHAWIKNRMAKFGISADEVVDSWCLEFPHRNREIEMELRAVAAELDAA